MNSVRSVVDRAAERSAGRAACQEREPVGEVAGIIGVGRSGRLLQRRRPGGDRFKIGGLLAPGRQLSTSAAISPLSLRTSLKKFASGLAHRLRIPDSSGTV